MIAAGEVRHYGAEALLPAAWRWLAAEGPVRCFNPGLLADAEGWLLAFRVVGADGRRRIGLCRLDRNLAVVPGSALPLSDTLALPPGLGSQAYHWFADPRLYRLREGLFLYWNSGCHEPRNHQFLQRLDPASLRPLGPVRELLLQGPGQAQEKNWTLFEADGLHAVYAPQPHQVLALAAEAAGSLHWRPAAAPVVAGAGFAARFAPLRGGAPPQRQGNAFTSFCHCVVPTPRGYRYLAAAYRFSAEPPFLPLELPLRPLPLHRLLPGQGSSALNDAVAEVAYACGAAWHGGQWLVSLGITDATCAILALDAAAVDACLAPAASALDRGSDLVGPWSACFDYAPGDRHAYA